MKVSELLILIEKKFIKAMQRKTGWGKNEIIEEFNKAIKFSLYELAGKEEIDQEEGAKILQEMISSNSI